MEKETLLRRSLVDAMKDNVMNHMTQWADALSVMVEEDISPLQLLCIFQAVISFVVLVFAVCVPLPLRCVMLAWFASSVWQCKRAGLK